MSAVLALGQPLCVLRQAQHEEFFSAISDRANKNLLSLSLSKAARLSCKAASA